MNCPTSALGRTWHVGVVIPACNEEATIADCVRSVRASLRDCDRVALSWIVVAADSCTDATAQMAIEALGDGGEVIECRAVSAGTARRIGASRVLHRFHGVAAAAVWIANTDADSFVPPDWIERQIAIANVGTAAVAGIVRVESVTGCSAAQVNELLADYEVNEDGTHPHVHGANIGVRADAYLAAGGWHDKALAEDHCLWGRLRGQDWPMTSSTGLFVTTSGRLAGRATGGFASTLAAKVDALYA